MSFMIQTVEISIDESMRFATSSWFFFYIYLYLRIWVFF